VDSPERPSPQHVVSMSRLGRGRLAAALVDQRARTKRARIRDKTLVDLAVLLGGTGVKITVAENDGSRWSMTLWPGSNGTDGQDATA
jgi:hypothetical protein